MPGSLERMPVDRRRMLVRTAAIEFASVGYERASLNRIIAACGMSKSSFYYVISSKQELFDLVVRELGRELVDAIAVPEPSAFAGERFWPTAERLVGELGSVAARGDAYTALGRMFYLSSVPDEAQASVADAFAAVRRWLQSVLQVGRDSGAIRDDSPIELQAITVFAVLRALDEWVLGGGVASASAQTDELMSVQLAGLRRMLEPSGM